MTSSSRTRPAAGTVDGTQPATAHRGASLLIERRLELALDPPQGGDLGLILPEPDRQPGHRRHAERGRLADGSTFEVGAIRIQAMHTPGHTPEHLAFLVTDTAGADQPMGVLTGDFLFVGDVGRPDLLERAVKVAGSMERSARDLFASLQRFRQLPEYLQVWPGHGAGSACGKSLSAVPQSTLGYERLFNWAFGVTDEAEFVRLVLDGQPDPPAYFAMMKSINRLGPPIRGAMQRPVHVTVERLVDALGAGAFVIDTRPAASFAAAHLRGSINIPLDRSFSTWAGWLTPYDRDLYLVADERRGRGLDDAIHDLSAIGLDRVVGYTGTSELERWTGAHPAGTVRQLSPADLAERLRTGDVAVVDVRAESEFAAGRLPGAMNIPVGQLPNRLDALPRDRLVVLQCQSGGRSSIAASVLVARGFANVVNLTGGINGWRAAGYPLASAGA